MTWIRLPGCGWQSTSLRWLAVATLVASSMLFTTPALAATRTGWEKMYEEKVLQSTAANAQTALNDSLQRHVLPALPLEQRAAAQRIRIVIDREAVEHPLMFYADLSAEEVHVSASTLRLLGDLLYAWGWLAANGNSPDTVLAYLSMLKYQYAGKQQASATLAPLGVLGVPASVRDDPVLAQQVNWQYNSAVFFLLCHEVGHIVLRHRTVADGLMPAQSRIQEQNADAFALNVMRSIGQTPEGLVMYFLFASVLEMFAVDDKTVTPFVRTHPLNVDRILAMVKYIRSNADSFAQVQVDTRRATQYYLAIADQIETAVKRVLDDDSTQRWWQSTGTKSTLMSLGPRPIQRVAVPEFKDSRAALGQPKAGSTTARTGSVEGRWIDDTSILHRAYYDFRPDNTYVFVSLFKGVTPKIEIEIREQGTYATRGDVLTLTPTKKTSKKDGVEEPDKVREQLFHWAIKPMPGTGQTLELSSDNSKFVYRSE
jgi:Peptidase family M48